VLGRLPGTDTYRNVLRHPEALAEPGVAILRVDAALCFANAEFMRDRVRMMVEPPVPALDPPRVLILDFHAVNGVDSTALHQIEETLTYLGDLGVGVRFAGVKGPVMDRLRRGGVDLRVGLDRFHLEVSDAVSAAAEEVVAAGAEAAGGSSREGRTTTSNSRSGMAGSSPDDEEGVSTSRATSIS